MSSHNVKSWTFILALTCLIIPACKSNQRYLTWQKGEAAAYRGDDETAAKYFDKVAQQKPSYWQAHYQHGLSLFKIKQYLSARLALERAISINPTGNEHTIMLDRIAECLFQEKRYETLRQRLIRSTDEYGQAEDFTRLGKYLLRIGDHDGAQLALRKSIIFAKKGDDKPYHELGVFYQTIGDNDNALLALRRAYTQNPKNLDTQNRLRQLGVIPGPTILLQPDTLNTAATNAPNIQSN